LTGAAAGGVNASLSSGTGNGRWVSSFARASSIGTWSRPARSALPSRPLISSIDPNAASTEP
jgi:hypothetical protein